MPPITRGHLTGFGEGESVATLPQQSRALFARARRTTRELSSSGKTNIFTIDVLDLDDLAKALDRRSEFDVSLARNVAALQKAGIAASAARTAQINELVFGERGLEPN